MLYRNHLCTGHRESFEISPCVAHRFFFDGLMPIKAVADSLICHLIPYKTLTERQNFRKCYNQYDISQVCQF